MKSTIEKALQKQKEALLKNKLTNQNSESTNANFTSETVQPSSDVSIW
jgi:hypothetical protein